VFVCVWSNNVFSHLCVDMYMYMYVCTYVDVYLCIYVHVYIHINIEMMPEITLFQVLERNAENFGEA